MREGNTGPLLSKWLGGDHADAARLAKRMYAQVMIAIQHLYIKRGADDVCTKEEMFGQPVSGVLAYVYQRQKTWQRDRYIAELKGSIGERPNHSNHSNHSNSFKIGIFPRKFKNFGKFQHFLNYRRNSDKISSKSEQKSVKRIQK